MQTSGALPAPSGDKDRECQSFAKLLQVLGEAGQDHEMTLNRYGCDSPSDSS
jgi:hypothetical protein